MTAADLPRCPKAPGPLGDHYPYTFAEVSPTAWTQVCDRCGHRTRINAPTVPAADRRRRRPSPPAPLPYSVYTTIGFQT